MGQLMSKKVNERGSRRYQNHDRRFERAVPTQKETNVCVKANEKDKEFSRDFEIPKRMTEITSMRSGEMTDILATRGNTTRPHYRQSISENSMSARLNADCVLLTQLINDAYHIEMSMIVRNEESTASVSGETGCARDYFNRLKNLCLFPLSDEVIVIPDASQHAKLWQHPMVLQHPKIKFYVSAPLKMTGISKDIIGYLCMADAEPRNSNHMDNHILGIFQQIIQSCLLRQDNPIARFGQGNVIIIVNMTDSEWQIIAANDVWQLSTKVYSGARLLQQFSVHGREQDRIDTAIERREGFDLTLERLSMDGHRYDLKFCPFESDPSNRETSSTVYFAFGQFLEQSLNDIDNKPGMPGLKLDGLLGKGSFGEVYKGSWKSMKVAVKKIISVQESETCSFPKEIELGKRLQHANVIMTLDHIIQKDVSWVILELCDRGSLLRLIDSGYFRSTSLPNCILERVLDVATQIASGMQYLHENEIIHGDLSTNNVLLTKEYHVKIADFGLSRVQISTQQTKTYGTITHMPPELLEEEILSTAADVYSFGIILYELLTSKRAYANMRPAQIMTSKLTDNKFHLQISENIIEPVKLIVDECLCKDYHVRPKFSAIASRLEHIKETYHQ